MNYRFKAILGRLPALFVALCALYGALQAVRAAFSLLSQPTNSRLDQFERRIERIDSVLDAQDHIIQYQLFNRE